MRTIKKYSNRRMYDTEESKAVTLEDIAKLIKDGEDIKVIDNSTGEDITTNVLLQTLLKIDQRLDKDSEIKNLILKSLIKEYIEKPFSLVKNITLAGMGIADLTKRDFDNFLEYLINQGRHSQKDGADFLREALDKASDDIKKGAVEFADNLTNTLSKLNVFNTSAGQKAKSKKQYNENKLYNKSKQEKTTSENNVDTNDDIVNEITDDKDKKIEQLEKEIQKLKKELKELKFQKK